MSFLCEPCIAWLSDVVQTLRIDNPEELFKDPSFRKAESSISSESRDILVAECNHQREYNDLINGAYSCWFCCRFLVLSAGLPGRRPKEDDSSQTHTGKDSLFSGINQVYEVQSELHMGMHLEIDTYRPEVENYGPNLILTFSIYGRSFTFQWNYLCHCDDGWGHGDRAAAQLECVVRRNDQTVLEASYPLYQQLNQHFEDSGALNESRISRIRSLLKACTSGYNGCSIRPVRASELPPDPLNRPQTFLHKPARRLPRRLVYIPAKQREDIRLIETSSVDAKTVQYATLSHCWGTDPFLILTRDNRDAFEKSIPSSSLSKTFRESITLCRALNIEYIWIDCLCIIQDSPDGNEWMEEASRMHEIYGGSLLTIAASSGSASSAGLFRPANHLLAQTVCINLPAGQSMHCNRGSYEFGRLDLEASPILHRGWATQELFMSQRVLYWTRNQLVWRCSKASTSELSRRHAFDDVAHHETPSHRDDEHHDWPSMKGLVWGAPVTADDIGEIWDLIIEDFSGCGLTRSIDRYFALSGLASYLHAAYKRLPSTETSRYLAGHWEHELVPSLCWRKMTPGWVNSLEPDTYIPTWSVLRSCEANSRTSYKTYRSPFGNRRSDRAEAPSSMLDAKVLEAKVEYAHPAQVYGPLKSASLCLKVFLSTLIKLDRDTPGGCWRTRQAHLRARGRPDLVWSSEGDGVIWIDFCLDSVESFAKLASSHSSESLDRPQATSQSSSQPSSAAAASIRSLQCALILPPSSDAYTNPGFEALVVEKIPSSQPGHRNEFQRLGQLALYDHTDEKKFPDHKKHMLEWFERDEAPFEEIVLV